MPELYARQESEGHDSAAEYTFNRTHTLTRDKGFVPLSETNLRKAAEESVGRFGVHSKAKGEHSHAHTHKKIE